MSTPPLNPLVEKIRAKYPGAYDDMDDAALTKAVLKKYPQYADLTAAPMSKPPDMIQKQEFDNPASPNFRGGNTIPGAYEGMNASGDEGQAAAMTGAGAAVAAAAAVPLVGPVLGTAAKWAALHPVQTEMGIHLARRLGVPIPKVLDAISEFSGTE